MNRHKKPITLTPEQIAAIRKELDDKRDRDLRRKQVRCAKCQTPVPCRCR